MKALTPSRLRPLGLALCLALAYPVAHGLPQGAQVVQGQVKVTTPQPGQGLIVQGTDKAIVNWQGFSIGASESLRIEQPSVNSVLLNRVVGGDPSLILGRMQSNGQVFLLNPRGIVFGRGSQVDVGGLVASTLDLSDTAFIAGNYSFTASPGAGKLQADGSITAAGTVALLAPQLDVSGSIQARRVGLAAATGVTVDVEGDGLVLFNLRNDDQDAALKFSGRIQAEGGNAELRAQARAGVAAQVLNMDGVVQARGLRQSGGRIVIDGGTAGDTIINGTLDAVGQASTPGGSITVLGQRVALLDAARVDASGPLGGGSLQIGGGFHGEGTDHNAERTWIAPGAQLRADATEQGDGGRIAVWADRRTDVFGQISARGGQLGGNGGSVETSGKEELNMPSGSVDVGAPRGQGGHWLLDPHNLDIVGTGSDTNVNPAPAPFVTSGNSAKLTVTTLNAALTGGATVVVRTAGGATGQTGNIDVQATIAPAGTATLNLVAQGDITFTGGKIAAGSNLLNVNLLAGSDAAGANAGGVASTITATGTGTIIDTHGGTLTATAHDGITFGGVTSGALTLTSSGGAVVLPTGTVTGALVANSGGGAITQATGGLVVTSTSSLTATSAAITLTDTHNDFQQAVSLTGGTTQITNTRNASNTLTLGTLATGNLTATAGGGTLTLGTGTVTGTLTANSGGGAITQATGGLVVTGTSGLTATGANITLADTHNDFQDAVSLTGTATQIVNTKNASNALKLGTLATGNLTATAGGGALTLGTGTVTGTLTANSGGGAITQAAGGLVVTGTSGLTATGANITLADTHNDFQDAVSLTGTATQIVNTKNASNALKLGTLATGNLTATAGGGTLTLGTGTVTGTLTANSGGAITQAAGGLVVTGTSGLTATGANITLTDTHNDFQDAVSLTGTATQIVNTKNASNALKLGTLATGNLTATAGGGALTLGTGTVTGTLTANSGGGAITQAAGGLVVTGTSGLTATGAAITLADANNDFQAAVSFTGTATQIVNTKNVGNALTLGTLSTGNLIATAGGGTLTLGTGTVTGTLAADSGGGAIAQAAGGLVVTGTSSLTATGAAITLADAANNLQGAVSLTGGATQVVNTKNASNALTLGTLNTGDLNVTAGGGALNLGSGTVTGTLTANSGGGAITQAAGGLVVTGTSGLTAIGAAITLADANNDFQAAVSLTGTATQIVNTKNASNALTLGTLSTGNLIATAGGGTLTLGTGTVTGTLAADSGGGALTQAAGGLVVTGTSTLTATGATITLTDTHNDLQGTVAITSGAAQLVNTKNVGNTLTLGTLSTADLTVTAGGGALNLGTGTVTGALSATSGGGAITQASGGLVVTGTSSVNAGSAAVTLLDAANNLQGAVSLTGAATQVSNGSGHALLLGTLSTGALTATSTAAGVQLGTGTVTGNLVANAGGALTQAAGGLVVTGTSGINAGSAAITLTDTHNDLQGVVTLTGGATQLRNSKNAGNALTLGSISTADLTVTAGGGALNLGTGTVGGNLAANSGGGAITQGSGGLVVTGTSSFDAGSAAVTLLDAANNLQGAVSLTGGITQVSNGSGHALLLGTLSTGALTATSTAAGLQLGTGTVTGNLVANAGGALTQATGGLVVTGTSGLNAGSAAITLTDTHNDFQDTVNLTGAATQIVNTKNAGNALKLGTLATTGNLIATAGGGTLTLGTGTVTGTLTANSGGGAITQAVGGLVVTGTSSLTATGAAITLTDADNNLQGAVSLTGGATQLKNTKNVGNALTLATLSTGNLTVTAGGGALNLGTGTVGGALSATSGGGAITQASGGLVVTGTSSVNAGSAAVTLLDAANNLQGAVSLTGGTTQVSNGSGHALLLGTLSTGALTATSTAAGLQLGTGTVTGNLVANAGGAMTQAAGGLVVTGTSVLNAGSAAITLTDTHNDLQGVVTLTGGATQLSNNKNAGNALTLGSISTADLTVTAGGGALNLGTGTVGGNLSASSGGGAITQASGGLAVTGTSSVNAGSAAVTLLDAANNLQGAVSLTGGTTQVSNGSGHALLLGTLSTGALTATSTAAGLQLGTGTVAGNLVANAGGALTQATGGLVVTGTAGLNAGSAAITLADTHNDLQGTVNLTGGATQIVNTKNAGNALTLGSVSTAALTVTAGGGTLNLGTGTVGGNLSANSGGGAITQAAGGLVVTGTAGLNAGSAALTLLDNANDLQGVVSLTGGAAQLKNTRNAGNALTLGSVSTAALTVTANGGALNLGTGTVTGTLSATSGGGAITQAAGGLVVTGTASLNAGSAAITLTENANDLQGAVSLTGGTTQIKSTKNAGNALTLATLATGSLTATAGGGTLRLGTGTVTGALSANSGGGAVTQAAGGLVVTGTSALNAGSAAITLADNANDLQGAVSLTGGATQIKNTRNAGNALTLATLNTGNLAATAGGGVLNLGTGTVAGTLSATSGGGAITQAAGGLGVAGNATLNAGSAAITLNNANNDFGGSVGVTGGATALASTRTATSTLAFGALATGNLTASTAGGNLTLGTGTVAGTLNAASNGGDLGQIAGGITVSGVATLNAGAGNVNLTDTHNHWNGGVQLTGNLLNLRSAGDLNILALTQPANRTLTLAADGNLTLGAVDLDTGTADLSLTSLGGSFTAGGKLAGHNIALAAQAGLNLGRDITATGTLGLTTATGGIHQTGGVIQATGALSLTAAAGGIVQTGGALHANGVTTVAAGASAITLASAGNHFSAAVQLTGGNTQITDSGALTLGTLATGALTATSTGALNLGQGTVTGALVATSNGGSIGQAGALTVTGTSTLNAGSGAITLAQAANDLQGGVGVTGGAISLRTAHDLTLTGLSQTANQALDLEATGVLTLPVATTNIDTGTAALTLIAGGGAINAPGTLNGSDITLRGTAVTLAHDVTASGNLDVRSTATTINQTAGRIAVAGTSQFNAGTQALTLGGALNDFQGDVTLSGGATQISAASLHALNLASLTTGNLTIASGNALRVGTGTVSGNLAATSAGALTQAAGGVAVTGTSSFNAGSAALTLLDTANTWGGAVGLTGGATQLRGTGAIVLAAGSTGSLALASGGPVSQNAAITVAGALNVNAGGAAIDLSTATNSLNGPVTLTGGASQVRSAGALTLGTLATGALTARSGGALNLGQGTVGGSLSADSGGGAVSQSGALDIAGTTNVQAGTGSITLTQAANHWGGAVSLGGGATQVTSVGPLGLGTLAVGALTVDATGALNLGQGTVGGNLLATSHGGAIGQAGALDVAGTANLQAGAGAITLTQAANRWRSAVQLAGATTQVTGTGALAFSTLATGSLTAMSTGALNLGQGTVNGTLLANGGGNAVTQGGALQVSGGTTVNAGAGNITLADPGNQLQGPLSLTANAVTVVNQPALDFATLNFNSLDATSAGNIHLVSGSLTGTLAARAGGTLTQGAGGLAVAGSSTLQAANGITLADAANQLQGTVNLAGGSPVALTNAANLHLGTLATGNLSLNVAGTLDLGAGSVGGNLSATSSGAVTQTGALAVTGSTTLNAGSAAITLGQAGNALAGTVNLSGGDTQLTNGGALSLGSVAVGNLTVASAGALQLGSGTIGGTLGAVSGGAITQLPGGLAVSGAASLAAGGNAIQLTSSANALAGAVSLAGGDVAVANSGALKLGSVATHNLGLTAGGDIDLGAGSVGGTLSASTQGTRIGQTGALAVAGTSSFTADGGAVTLLLDPAANQLQGAVNISALHGGIVTAATVVNAVDLNFTGDVQALTLTSGGALTLGGSRSTTLTATARNGIAQTGALDVSGLTTLVATGAAMPVTLTQSGNDLTRVQLTAQPGGSFARVQLRDDDAARHDGLQATGDAASLEITSAGALDLGGGNYVNLLADTRATGAALTQSGRLAVSGLVTIQAGRGNVTLARTDNSLPGLAIASAGSATVASAGNVTVSASNVSTRLDFNSPGAVTLQGPLGGSGELVISGTGSLTINSAQTYSGGTRIQSGSLVLQGGAAQAGSGAVQLAAAGQLDLRDGATLGNALVSQGGSVLNSSGTGTLAGAVTLQALTPFLPAASAGGLTVSGPISDGGTAQGLRLGSAGTLTLAGTNSYSGTTDIAAGTLRAAGLGALPSASAVQLAAGAVLALGADQAAGSLSGAGHIDLGSFTLGLGADGRSTTFNGDVVGSGGLAKLGAGTFTLAGTGAHTGATRVAAGQLVLASGTALNASTAVSVEAGATLTVQQSISLGSLAGSGTVAVQAPLLSVGANGGSTTFDGALTGPGGLAKLGAGRLTLAGHHTLAGDVQVNGGSLQLATAGVLPAASAIAVASGATLELLTDQNLGALTGGGQVLLNPNTLTLGASGRDGRFDGVVSGAGNLTKAGSGTVTLGGANLFTGTTHVSAGSLVLDTAQALAGTSTLQIDTPAQVRANAAQAVAVLGGAGSLVLNGAPLAVGAGGADSRFDGIASGSGSLVKQGAGRLVLTAAQANTGATSIEAGTVALTASGSLGAGDVQNQGTLSLERSDALTLGQAISGSGRLVVQLGPVTLANGGNSYSGATQVLGGSLITTAAERLPNASAVTVAAGAQLQLGGNETIASLQAAGSVKLAGDLTTTAAQTYTGSLTLANTAGLTLSGTVIDASRSTNQFAGTPLGLSGGQALITVKESLQLGNVTLSGGGRIEAERLAVNGKLQLTGGSLALVATAAPDDAKAVLQGIAQVPLAGVALAVAEATVQEGTAGAITVAEGAKLAVQASGGGSVVLGQDANNFRGQLSVLSGANYGTAWVPNVKGSQGIQSLVRIAGQQMQVGGSGVEGDIVSLRADQLATADGAKLVARLPFDETLLGKTLSLPSMTLELTPAAFTLPNSFGIVGGVPIQVEVGSTATGNRTTGPNAGYLTVLPKGGAQGATVIVLSGPEVSSGSPPYRFFHDGARQAAEVPVVYNGILPLTPSASGALSSINGDAEDARRARFQETVRTENVTVRLRSGVIAEVGPGRPSTSGSEGAAPPVQCDPAPQPALSCKTPGAVTP